MTKEEEDILEIARLSALIKIHDKATFIPTFKSGDQIRIKPDNLLMHAYLNDIYILEEDSFLNYDQMECLETHKWGVSLADGYMLA